MSPAQFKSRYIESLPVIPPELNLQLDNFSAFPATLVGKLNISDSDRAILIDTGLPESASPFLNFRLSPEELLQPLSTACGGDPAFARYIMIGSNGSGDTICIDQESDGAVVYLNHDWEMKVVFMNSNVTTLAESLSIYAESLKTKDAIVGQLALSKTDPTAMTAGNFWPAEFDMMQSEINRKSI